MGDIYVFKVMLVGNKHAWRTIEIEGRRRLSKLDSIIQEAFDHEPFHLSEFEFKGIQFLRNEDLRERRSFDRFRAKLLDELSPRLKTIRRQEYRSIRTRIESIGLKPRNKMKYTYDFGEDIRHAVELIKIKAGEKGVKYPVVGGGDTNAKCGKCRKNQAVFWCHSCHNQVCEDCIDEPSRYCREGYYPLLKIFHSENSSQWH